MLKKKLRKRIILLLFFVTMSYLIFGMIPMFQGKEVTVDAPQTYEHPKNNGYYRLEVEKGVSYTFTFNYYIADGIDPKIRLFSHSFKTIGIQKNSGPGTQVTIGFSTEHAGYYYITVVNTKGAFCSVLLEEYVDQDGLSNQYQYVSPVRIILIITIAILFTSSIVLSIANYLEIKKKEAREWEIKNTVICPTCGIKYVKDVKYCTTCGYTFEKPKEYKNY